MATSLDNLNITISARTKTAVDNVNKLVGALDKLKESLNSIDTKGLEATANAANKMSDAFVSMKNSRITQTVRAVAKSTQGFSAQAESMQKTADAAKTYSNAVDQVAGQTQKVADVASDGGKTGFQQFLGNLKMVAGFTKNAITGIAGFGEKVANAFKKIFPHASKAANAIKKTGKSSASAAISAKGLAKELLRVGKMFKLMITRMILRKIITGIGDGFKNLAQYSTQVNASISLLWNSFRQLGNSIAAAVSPLLNAFAPALNYLIQLIIKAVNAINQLVSALLGLGTWTRAKTLTDSYADSLKKAGGAAKELKKTVLGFDELNQLQDNSSGGGGGATSPADMFEEAGIDDKWKEIADKIRKYWEKLVNPIKRAWARAGEYVKKAWSRALENLKTLAMDIVDDFLEVWNQPRTVQMLEDLFRIVGNIGTFIGNLAKSFDDAWNKAEVGKRIFEDVRNICADIVAVIEDITLSWALWADKVNFTPLLEGLEGWLSSLEAPVQAIMGVISDLNDHFVQPIAKWLIEEGVPSLIQVFTDFNNKVHWDEISDRIDRVAEALAPFATSVGEGLISFIGDVSDALAGFLNSEAWDGFVDTLVTWTSDVDGARVANDLHLIAGAFLAFKGLTWLATIIAALEKFSAWVVSAYTVLQTYGPYIIEFCEALARGPEGFVAGASMAWDEWIAGTFLDPNEWGGTLGQLTGNLAIFWNNVLNISAFAIHGLNDLVEGNTFGTSLLEDIQSFDKYNEACETLREHNDTLKGSYDEVIARAKKYKDDNASMTTSLTQNASTLKKNYFDPLENSTKQLYDTTETSTYNMKQSYAGLSRDIPVELQTLQKSQDGILDDIRKSFDKSNWTFSGVADGLGETFESAKSAIKGVWNSIADSLNGTHSIGNGSFRINLPKLFATGGFPEDGLFMANHNELVGRFSNGKTAVANNEQITDGIARAVYSAITAANGGGGSASYINNTIEIDGVAIARAVTKGQSSLNRRYSPTMA